MFAEALAAVVIAAIQTLSEEACSKERRFQENSLYLPCYSTLSGIGTSHRALSSADPFSAARSRGNLPTHETPHYLPGTVGF